MQQEIAAPSDQVWRVFAAIELPTLVQQRIREMIQRLKAAGWDARWVRPESSHLTLKFYGDVSTQRLPELSDALGGVARNAPALHLRTSNPGVFPSARRPRVLWLGIAEPTGRLQRLYDMIERASIELGFTPENRNYHPHLTVARFRPDNCPTIEDLAARFAETARLPAVEFSTRHLALYLSDLSQSAARYTVIDRFELDTTS